MVDKKQIINSFSNHVSRGKANFFAKYGMDFVMGRREGPWLWDIDSQKKLYNLHSNGGVFNLGHKNPEIIHVLSSELQELDIGNHHLMSKHRADLAEHLCNTFPNELNVCVFGVSGGESVDLAIKVAKGYTKRKQIVSAKGGYHGHTGLAIETGDEKYKKPFNLDDPNFIQVPFGDIDYLKKTITNKTAALILEPIPATLGIVIPDINYLSSAAEICKENGALLIIDEVQTGLGRTGKMWAIEHFDVIPDMVVVGKGLSGGVYPITATILKEKLQFVFEKDPFVHVSTFGGSELGCKVALKVLELTNNPRFLDEVEKKGQDLEIALQPLLSMHKKLFKGIRRKGLMLGLEFGHELAGPVMTKTAYDNGLLMIYANNDTSVCQVLPPLTFHLSELEYIISSLDKAMSQAKRLLPAVKIKKSLGL